MTKRVFGNFAYSRLTLAIDTGATSLIVRTGEGARFPQPVDPEVCVLALEDAQGARELVHMTERNGDVLTVVRGREGTPARAYDVDTRVEQRVSAGTMQELGGATF